MYVGCAIGESGMSSKVGDVEGMVWRVQGTAEHGAYIYLDPLKIIQP